MALSGSSRRWFLRNLRQASIVLVCAAVIVGSLIYFVDGSPVRHEITRPQSNGANNEHRYAGSIILPTHGGRCWEAVFDNRTGRMIDKGSLTRRAFARRWRACCRGSLMLAIPVWCPLLLQ